MQSQSTDIPSAQQRKLEEELYDRASRVKPEDEGKVLGELPGKIAHVVESAKRKTPGVKSMIQNVKMLYEMLRDKNFSISWSAKAIILASLLYFISPIDLIPDFIPLLGYIDDAFVISAGLNAITSEIERYRTFKEA